MIKHKDALIKVKLDAKTAKVSPVKSSSLLSRYLSNRFNDSTPAALWRFGFPQFKVWTDTFFWFVKSARAAI